MRLIIVLTLLMLSNLNYAQETYGIKNPKNKAQTKCKDCLSVIAAMPKEIQFSVKSDNYGNIFFVMNSKDWFNKLIKNNSYGIAVDIITKDQYACGKKNNPPTSWASFGVLLPPVYKNEMKKKLLVDRNGIISIPVGKVPNNLLNHEYECNILVLKNKYLCHYRKFIKIENYKWDLLDMGLYMDTIVYNRKIDTTKNIKSSLLLQSKRLKFVFPFEKNKSDYSPADMKPLYDSLKLTDYVIKNIEILAYSSVEGPTKRNIELQNQRAQSILSALQSFQTITINASVSSSENWVEFFNDISDTKFANFGKLSQTDIKSKLSVQTISKEIEPILQKHRKAILLIDLEKKVVVSYTTPAQILDQFEKAIINKNIKEAIQIQQVIFSKIVDNTLPNQFLNSMEIPEKSEYSILLNNQSVFKFLIDESGVYETYMQFVKLHNIFPNDSHIQYNICALRFKMWLFENESIDPATFKSEIENLKKYKIPQNLINRMLVNYNIIMCEKYMNKNDFKNKDLSLQFIYYNYKKLPLKAEDLLSLAQYFVSFSKFDWAIELLKPYIKQIDVNEDLLFYYLNLTITDSKLTNTGSYKTYLLNAMNRNKVRFCKMFKSARSGGVTFQLLDNDYMKVMNCDNCEK